MFKIKNKENVKKKKETLADFKIIPTFASAFELNMKPEDGSKLETARDEGSEKK